jgi:hypothetical protein
VEFFSFKKYKILLDQCRSCLQRDNQSVDREREAANINQGLNKNETEKKKETGPESKVLAQLHLRFFTQQLRSIALELKPKLPTLRREFRACFLFQIDSTYS